MNHSVRRERLAMLLATCGGAGHARIAPGTVGSALGLGVWVIVHTSGGPWAEPVVLAALFLVGTWAADTAERVLGRKDPPPVVIDEVVGMLVTMIGTPASAASMAAGFVLFRACDIIKPFPARRLERTAGGLGVMLDDVVAGAYAALMLKGWLWLASNAR